MTALDDAGAVFRRHLHLPDLASLYAVLGATAANKLDGDPVWMMLVGSPSSGKTEQLQPLTELDGVYQAATLTEAALLSGSPKREQSEKSTGGLLRTIGEDGIMVCKDFGSVLNMNREARASLLAALREVYDGHWTRHVGTDGGKTLEWEGRVGLLAGCTPAIDRHHAVMGSMGERFVLFRLAAVDPEKQAKRALEHSGKETEMRGELVEAVTAVFQALDKTPRQRSAAESERLVQLAVLVVRCRSAVERDGLSREVELIPASESPARLVVVLDRLLSGLYAIGLEPDQAWRVVGKAALDSIPALRRVVMNTLAQAEDEIKTAEVAEAIGYPSKTAERALEDLVAHGIAEVHRHGQGKATTWTIDENALHSYETAQADISDGATSPEMSVDAEPTSPEKSADASISLRTHTKDISGEVAEQPQNGSKPLAAAVGAREGAPDDVAPQNGLDPEQLAMAEQFLAEQGDDEPAMFENAPESSNALTADCEGDQ